MSSIVHPATAAQSAASPVAQPYEWPKGGLNQPAPVTRHAPWIEPPPNAEPFGWDHPQGLSVPSPVVMPAIGASAAIVQFLVPQNRSGVITRIANASGLGGWTLGDWVNGNGQLVWQILHDGVAFKGFASILTLRGLVEDGGSPLGAPIRIKANQVISLVLINNGVPQAGQSLLGLLAGYYYPSKLDTGDLR